MQSLNNLDYASYLKNAIRTVPDWPHEGVMFRDITPLLQNPKAFRLLIDVFVHRYMDADISLVAGLDARGFIIGSVLAYELNVGFVPIRKKGKLPFTTIAEGYELEYGNATVEMHTDACRVGDRVVLIDDLVATGGTMMAGYKLLQKLGADVVEAATIIELPELKGGELIRSNGLPLYTVCSFDGA
ncbi:adenine phosphoribosyltransferase [Crenobacter cavernae]|uniref:Adenine phosphoribosyltransferase n=1 Tax=Crenobacter cavernae TaxID=2290923 RepID=A0ABY0FE70_9NEIS|nr:adenine phosphoribosyltransferase [Crenobacter cavernae]RXZ43527.1 adenine phosphoribosyltransferase [Crenobacter cavernae]